MNKLIIAAMGIGGCVLFFGCAQYGKGIPEVTPEMAMENGVEETTLARGRGIYMAHCAACHERVHPGEIDPEFWRGITHHMAIKSKLTSVEEEQLLRYVMAAHADVHDLNPQH